MFIAEWADENRDDWLWSGDGFWRYPFYTIKECPRGYGWEGEHSNGRCRPCEAGEYSESWGPTVRCLQCPRGYFQPRAMQTSCRRCPIELSDGPEGAVNPDACKAIDPHEHGELMATVEVMVKVVGDASFLEPVLEELSGYGAHRMHGHVE